MSNTEAQTIIHAEDLTRTFDEVVAVDRLDLAVRRGEIFGLVGPDGAGKTTTIRMLATVMVPTGGQATVAGFDIVQEADQIKARIGYMAQQFSLYDELSVLENLAFFADIFDVRGQRRQARIQELLEFARLTDFTERRAARLSGGMKKKLALTCALIHEPEILLLDEPTNGVDPVSRREFWNILANLRAQDVTILISTPYMDEAERCSRVGLIYQGQFIITETPDRIKEQVEGELVQLRPVAEGEALNLNRRATEAVTDLEGVLEVQTYGDLLHVFVDEAQKRMPQIESALQEASIQAEDMRQTQPRMEEAFISLIRKHRAQKEKQEETTQAERS
jgi:ABC-2 type transport system ATP-binding protein